MTRVRRRRFGIIFGLRYWQVLAGEYAKARQDKTKY